MCKILFVTPAVSGGSWHFADEILQRTSTGFRVFIAALGRSPVQTKTFTVFDLAYPSYQRYGQLTSLHVAFAVFCEVPLAVLANLLVLIHRPKIVIGNGLLACLMTMPAARATRAKLILFHNGSIRSYVEGMVRRWVQIFAKFIEHVFVNSIGSRDDICSIINPERVTVVKHWADDLFFEGSDRDRLRNKFGFDGRFVVLYVGRLDRDKQVGLLLNVCETLKSERKFLFVFCGDGEFASHVQSMAKTDGTAKYVGHIRDRHYLRDLYRAADVVWSFADTTYIAKPAVEALACGTPIIIPDISAVPPKGYLASKFRWNRKVPQDLIPKNIGWIVDTGDLGKAVDLLSKIRDLDLYAMRRDCVSYAIKNHSTRNIEPVLRFLYGVSCQQ